MKAVRELTECAYGKMHVRVFGTKDEPWFVAVDVCKILQIKNSRDAVKRLDDDEKGVVKADTLGGKQELQIINEAGLYTLILKSRTEEAKCFKRWVTHDVLPRIRKYGYYKLTNHERRWAAYESIAENLGLSNVLELEDKYVKMSLKALEAADYELKNKAEIEAEAERKKAEEEAKIKEWHEKYPYSYEETDKLCKYEVEYLKIWLPSGDMDEYYKRPPFGYSVCYKERFSQKFIDLIPVLWKEGYDTEYKP